MTYERSIKTGQWLKKEISKTICIVPYSNMLGIEHDDMFTVWYHLSYLLLTSNLATISYLSKTKENGVPGIGVWYSLCESNTYPYLQLWATKAVNVVNERCISYGCSSGCSKESRSRLVYFGKCQQQMLVCCSQMHSSKMVFKFMTWSLGYGLFL